MMSSYPTGLTPPTRSWDGRDRYTMFEKSSDLSAAAANEPSATKLRS